MSTFLIWFSFPSESSLSFPQKMILATAIASNQAWQKSLFCFNISLLRLILRFPTFDQCSLVVAQSHNFTYLCSRKGNTDDLLRLDVVCNGNSTSSVAYCAHWEWFINCTLEPMWWIILDMQHSNRQSTLIG